MHWPGRILVFLLLGLGTLWVPVQGQGTLKKFSVIAFYTAQNDAAHISFVHEANRWFPRMACFGWDGKLPQFLLHLVDAFG